MSEILDDLRKIIANLPPFVGYTMQPTEFYFYERINKFDSQVFGAIQSVPNYCVPNQPCPIVKWTSREQMMKFVRRKDKEYAESSSG